MRKQHSWHRVIIGDENVSEPIKWTNSIESTFRPSSTSIYVIIFLTSWRGRHSCRKVEHECGIFCLIKWFMAQPGMGLKMYWIRERTCGGMKIPWISDENLTRSFRRWLRDKVWGCRKKISFLHHQECSGRSGRDSWRYWNNTKSEILYPIFFNNNLNIHDTDNSIETWKFYSLLSISRGFFGWKDFQCCLQLNTKASWCSSFSGGCCCCARWREPSRHMWKIGGNLFFYFFRVHIGIACWS